MWGAGQMMFNKILVLTGAPHDHEQSFHISDYKKLAQDVFKNMNPATDIYFSSGPMDVLDHSCSKLGFGGKMCIDGTWKYGEEKDELSALPSALTEYSRQREIVLGKFTEIIKINDSLLDLDIACLVISVKKNKPGHVRELHKNIVQIITGVKMILYVEHTVDANDLPVALWRFCNNIDPKRDNILIDQCMGFDGTIKTKELDNFQRDWPNIIIASDDTIRSVDAKWNSLGIGEFIPSPSLKFAGQVYGLEAVVSI